MKLFKKIILPLVAGVCAIAAFASFMACTDESGSSTDSGSVTESSNTAESSTSESSTADLDADLTDTQYVVYVYLDDGTTPVEGITFQLCYSKNSTQSTCSGTAYETDSNGRVLFDMTGITYVDAPVIHITTKYVADASGNYVETYVCLPDGYSIPSNGTTQTLNDGASYDDAWALTERVTTLTLTKN